MDHDYYEYNDNKESYFYASFIYTLPVDVQNYINEIKNYYSLYLLRVKLLMKIYVNGIRQLDNTYLELPNKIKLSIYNQILGYNRMINTYERDLTTFIGYDNLITFLLETPPAKIKTFKPDEMSKYFKHKYLFTKGVDQIMLTNLSMVLLLNEKFEEYFILLHHIPFLPILFSLKRF